MGGAHSRSRRTPEQERARAADPSRRRYRSAEFKRNAQLALERTGGCCAVTGTRIADRVGGRWRMRRGAGGVHHVVPIVEGGTDEPGNLVPLCASVHNRIEGELRRRRRGEE